ncbi:uncharacterized protein LOC115627667 [Scaptodrosophila lebanonensis]|uniref:Uncharacterized protein LOC115627667 n=1 Tax=Drosophila lebanonensis TaxID=7225 RepID=A0A6J2TT74_DROLE|nr:uncharacterized protein LOC115627667 [Scaptodrosophila lebanonensis]
MKLTTLYLGSFIGLGLGLWVGTVSSSLLLVDEQPPTSSIGTRMRLLRQVVQPSWLMQPEFQNAPPIEVRVTPQNLKETTVIREEIQKAVNDDTYVVASNPLQLQSLLAQFGSNLPSMSMPMSLPPLTFPRLPLAPFTLPPLPGWQWPNLLGQQQQPQEHMLFG